MKIEFYITSNSFLYFSWNQKKHGLNLSQTKSSNMRHELIHLRKGEFELDFFKHENGSHYACATNFANKCGMNVQSVNRVINTDEILRDVSTKLSMRDSKSRRQKMVFIHSDHFLYFLSLVKGLKTAAAAPDFVAKLILMYPKFVNELTKRVQILFERMEMNQRDQRRYDKLSKFENYCRTEKKRLVSEMKKRNTQEISFDPNPDGSMQTQLELDDRFYRNVEEVEFEEVDNND